MASTDGYDTNSDALIDLGREGYAGVYHELDVDGWTGPTGFYSRDFRALPSAVASKTWDISVWADPVFVPDTMFYSLESFGTLPINRHYALELVEVPDGVVGAPPVGMEWELPRDDLTTIELPTFRTMDGLEGYQFALTISAFDPIPSCDFDRDGNCNIDDLNSMLAVGPVEPGVPASGNEQFDLTGDEVIDNFDVDAWLAIAGAEDGFASPYKRGDANLDGVVDGQDFFLWNGSKFTTSLAWDNGDFNADGAVDGQDFFLWNGNKFTSSDAVAVPEPVGAGILLFAVTCVWLTHGRGYMSSLLSASYGAF